MSAPEEDYDESIYHIPKQKKSAAQDMGASLSVYPPLGQITQVQGANVQITALLEVPSDQANQPWEVALWHSSGDSDWVDVPLTRTDKTPSTLQSVDASVSRLWFEVNVPVQQQLNYTVKFRSASDQPWKWIRDEQGVGDGTIILTSNVTVEVLPNDFGSILKDYDSSIQVHPRQSQCPATRLWELKATADAAKGEDSTFTNVGLGLPWGGFLR